jgi:hypothetical protein
MARSTGEVQADIMVMRRVFERKLDTLHDRLPARWWLFYAWLAGGFATGLLFSRVPLLAMTASALRLAQLGLGLVATMKSVQHMLQDGGLRPLLRQSSRRK